MIQRECTVCGATFSVWPSKLRWGSGKFCSRKCVYAGRAERRAFEKPEPRDCVNCGKEFSARPSVIEAGGGMVCSIKCRALGQRNGNWKSDGALPVSIKMRHWRHHNRLKESARKQIENELRTGRLLQLPCEE